MREIEFRIRHRDREWFYGVPLTQIRNGAVGFKSFNNDYYDLFADAETLGQFTGLKDKNGTKIYEGDILARIYYDGTTRVEGVVKYGDFNCSCCDGVYGWYIDGDGDIRDLADSNYTPLFVIGNIYDNPELIKESE